MPMDEAYLANEPSRAEIDALDGPVLLEFGSPVCGHCRRAEPLIATALAPHPGVRRIRVADGAGQPLGRSFGVKLWPTLVFLDSGREIARLVRPTDSGAIGRALSRLDAGR